ncbi:hypothetical protein PR048_012141 [Dryococelus australis]|uniref:Uncharacterized protein n=1 Tax=Dryococelus australis TaxID=614101 RepID=A0ABQ9HNR2_9NEOP|nr:hypothetical protein PR048_012141 [Dryococelus australis]
MQSSVAEAGIGCTSPGRKMFTWGAGQRMDTGAMHRSHLFPERNTPLTPLIHPPNPLHTSYQASSLYIPRRCIHFFGHPSDCVRLKIQRGGRVVVRLLASHHLETGSIPGWVTPGFSHVWVFSGISRFPYPCIPVVFHTSITLISSQDVDVMSLPNLFTHSRRFDPYSKKFYNHVHNHLIYTSHGATVAEQLARWPPTKVIRAQSPAWSLRIFACGNRAGRCHWLAGFLGDLPPPPPLHSGAAPYSPQSPSSALKTSMLRAVQISLLHVSPNAVDIALVFLLQRDINVSRLPPRQTVTAGRRFFFLGELLFLTLFHFGAAPYSPRFTLIGSQDLDVKSCPNLFTQRTLICIVYDSDSRFMPFIRHALDNSAPIADSQGNKKRIPYCQMWGNTGATTNEQTSEVRLYKGLWSLAYRSLNSRSFPIQ